MDFALQNNSNGHVEMSYNAVNDIRNNILISLIVKKGTFFLDLAFGSLIHEVKTTSPSDLNLLKSYCAAALQWMIDIKKVKSFEILVRHYSPGTVIINITADLFDDKKVTYEHYLRVV